PLATGDRGTATTYQVGASGEGDAARVPSAGRRGAGSLVGGERQRHAVRPPKAVLRGILSTAGPPLQVEDVVLLGHLAGRAIGAPVHREPPLAGGIGQTRATVAAHALDRQPFQRRPSVGGVPLLTRRDQRRDESPRLQELPLEARGDRASLLGSGEPKIQRGRG